MGFKMDLFKAIVESVEIVETREHKIRIGFRTNTREQSFDNLVNGDKTVINDIFDVNTNIHNISTTPVDEIEYSLSHIITKHVRSLPGFDNRTANAGVRLSNRGMTVQIIRGNRPENYEFLIRKNWGFNLGDKFKMGRLGINDKIITEIEKLYL